MRALDKHEMIAGSMLWLDPWWDEGTIDELVAGMVSRGLIVARIFHSWARVEPYEGQWDDRLFDTLFRSAERRGLYITLTFGAGGPPLWMREKVENPNLCTIDNPEVWALALKYVEHTVLRYKDSPALHSWILWNEPSKSTVPNAFTLPAFRSFVRREHGGDIDHVNRTYFTDLRSFEDIGVVHEDGSGELMLLNPRVWGYGAKADWQRFCIEDMNRLLKDIQDTIRRFDTGHPTTVNPCHVGWQLLNNGQDIWSEGDLVDFLGCSCHTCSYDRPLLDRKHQHLSLVVDAVRSASADPDQVFWLTELQAGSIVYAGIRGFTPTAADIEHWMWEAYGSGARGVVYWLYAARDSGYEGSEWGLVSQYNGDTDRSIASKKVSDLLYANREFFQGLYPDRPDVHVLYSLCSEHVGALEVEVGTTTHGLTDFKGMDIARNYKLGGDAMFGAYSMAQDIGLHCGFIYENKIGETMPKGGVLLAGGAVCLPPEAIRAMKGFVRDGGTLIVDGLFGQKDPWGARAEDVRGEIEELFGTKMFDIHSQQEELTLDAGGMRVPGWYVQCEFEEGRIAEEDVLARFPDGRVAAFRHRYGKGQAIWIGTLFFQRYTGRPEDSAAEFLRSLLPPPNKPLMLVNPGKHLRMKRLCGKTGEALALLCYQEAKLGRVFSDAAVTLRDMRTGERFSLRRPGVLPIPMGSESTRVLRVERE